MHLPSLAPHAVRTRLGRSLLSAALLASAGCAVAADKPPIDCSVARADTVLSRCPVVRRASEFGNCLARADIERYSCVVMDTDLTFCEDEPPLPISVWFDSSGRTLDCAGGTIDHGWGRFGAVDESEVTPVGINLPLIRFVDDRSLSDIAVRNCTLRGTRHLGVQATRFFGGQLGGDGELGPDEPLPLGHHDLTFSDLTIQDVQVGIYLGNFSRDVTVERVTIDGTERIGLYSEAGTHRLRIVDSVFSDNRTREALALDSTYDSEVSGTLFVNNREGAINLYRNCGELKGVVCPVVRPTPANGNRIVGNAFVDNGVAGLRVASRQGRNHTRGWCSDLDGKPGKFTDTAEDNLVADNVFVCDEGVALAVMDGPNLVTGNRVVARGRCVPLEVSTGGFGRGGQALLDGLELRGNLLDATRPPRLRNVGPGVLHED